MPGSRVGGTLWHRQQMSTWTRVPDPALRDAERDDPPRPQGEYEEVRRPNSTWGERDVQYARDHSHG
jgi:hypothetical protein